METTAVVVNPSAGGGRGGRRWRELLAAEPELSQARKVIAESPEATLAGLDRELDEGVDRVLAVGGDGTGQLIAGRLLERGVADRVAFALLPAGTGSDLARCLGLPRRPAAALERVLAAEPRPIDVLRLESESGVVRHVINVASAGVSGRVDEVVNADPRRGAAKYLFATVRALLSYRPAPCRIETDGELFYEGEFFVAAVANGRSFGKGMRVAPEAELDDGLADVVVVPPVPLWQLPWRLPQFLTGRHLGLEIVHFTRARRVRIEPLAEMPPFDLDGEVFPSGPASLEVLPKALNVLA